MPFPSAYPLVQDDTTNLVYSAIPFYISHVACEKINVPIGGVLLVNTNSYAIITATVQSNNATVVYVAQTRATGLTSFVIRVYQSVNSVSGSPSMVPATTATVVFYTVVY